MKIRTNLKCHHVYIASYKHTYRPMRACIVVQLNFIKAHLKDLTKLCKWQFTLDVILSFRLWLCLLRDINFQIGWHLTPGASVRCITSVDFANMAKRFLGYHVFFSFKLLRLRCRGFVKNMSNKINLIETTTSSWDILGGYCLFEGG